ncbi:winged helix-turn-helix transcriptional regulator, partial [Bacillus sp. HY001]
PKVEYQLSEIGLLLEPVVNSICDWGDDFREFLAKDSNKKSVE